LRREQYADARVVVGPLVWQPTVHVCYELHLEDLDWVGWHWRKDQQLEVVQMDHPEGVGGVVVEGMAEEVEQPYSQDVLQLQLLPSHDAKKGRSSAAAADVAEHAPPAYHALV
jgi:hypothetical protein